MAIISTMEYPAYLGVDRHVCLDIFRIQTRKKFIPDLVRQNVRLIVNKLWQSHTLEVSDQQVTQ